MVEIKVGAELDMAVAEACGVKGWIESLRNEATGYESPGRFVLGGVSGTVFWEPSVDLNDAFFAAEQVATGDFSVDWHKSYGIDSRSGWCAGIDGSSFSTFSESPALAICAAILALKDGESSPSDDESFVAYARKRLHELGYHVS